jgi:hypothetical protein
MWNSRTVMYCHVLVCTGMYWYILFCQILLRCTGFQMLVKGLVLLQFQPQLEQPVLPPPAAARLRLLQPAATLHPPTALARSHCRCRHHQRHSLLPSAAAATALLSPLHFILTVPAHNSSCSTCKPLTLSPPATAIATTSSLQPLHTSASIQPAGQCSSSQCSCSPLPFPIPVRALTTPPASEPILAPQASCPAEQDLGSLGTSSPLRPLCLLQPSGTRTASQPYAY